MRSYGQLDDQAMPEGDDHFIEVNEKLDRALLQPGVLAKSINKRLRKGSANTRQGTVRPVFANIMALLAIKGVGVYSNPNGEEVLLVAGLVAVYAVRDGTYPRTIKIPAGTKLGAHVEFVQAFDKVLIFQGEEKPVLVWDGISIEGFKPIVKKNPADMSTVLIPRAVTAERFNDRILIANGDDEVIVSDILDYTSYDKITRVFRVNAGTSDRIVRIFPYARQGVIVFKNRSTYLLTNATTADPAEATVELINSQLGLAGRKAVLVVGADVLFLSNPGGIYRIAEVLENTMRTAPLPVSDPIQPVIDRINWAAATEAVAALLGEYAYFAVPLDLATANNAVIVYNTSTGKIEGIDVWPAPFQIDELKVTIFEGERRLYALDRLNASIYVLYEGKSDNIYDLDEELETEHEIEDLMETRGYAGLAPGTAAGMKRFTRAQVAVATWRPRFQVTSIVEGVEEEQPLREPQTKDRTKFMLHGKAPFKVNNINGDFDEPLREDYSVDATAGIYLGEKGIELERKQEFLERYNVHGRGRWVSLRIENKQGQCDVRGVAVESVPALGNRRLAA